MACVRPGGRSGRVRLSGGTAPEAARRAVSAGVPLAFGFVPVRHSYITRLAA